MDLRRSPGVVANGGATAPCRREHVLRHSLVICAGGSALAYSKLGLTALQKVVGARRLLERCCLPDARFHCQRAGCENNTARGSSELAPPQVLGIVFVRAPNLRGIP